MHQSRHERIDALSIETVADLLARLFQMSFTSIVRMVFVPIMHDHPATTSPTNQKPRQQGVARPRRTEGILRDRF